MNNFCPNCGAKRDIDIKHCANCGYEFKEGEIAISIENNKYADFGSRFAAYFIDNTVLFIISFMVGFILAFIFPDFAASSEENINMMLYPISFILMWLYFSLFESSKWQATIGKKTMKLKVVNNDGNRISFIRASVRYFSKIISGLILFIGYIMIAFDNKKQGLHDKIAKTYVIKDETIN